MTTTSPVSSPSLHSRTKASESSSSSSVSHFVPEFTVPSSQEWASGYYLTQHPSTRFPSGSPGTPERPLSDLGLKGYTAHWISLILRFGQKLQEHAPSLVIPQKTTPIKSSSSNGSVEVRALRRTSVTLNGYKDSERITADGVGQSGSQQI